MQNKTLIRWYLALDKDFEAEFWPWKKRGRITAQLPYTSLIGVKERQPPYQGSVRQGRKYPGRVGSPEYFPLQAEQGCL